jgi:uncharacterized protein
MDLPLSDYRTMSVQEFDTTKLLANARRQAEQRGYDRFPIVDVDAHHYEGESMKEILEYFEDPVLEQIAASSTQAGQKSAGLFGAGVGVQEVGGRITRYPQRKSEKSAGPEHRDVQLTRRWMNAMGVDMAVIFPTPMLHLGMHPQPEVEVQLARAYNRWMVERVLPQDKRMIALVYLPMNDPEASYQMAREFIGKPGVAGFTVTAVRNKPVHSNEYFKTYAAIQEAGMPIAFHAGINWAEESMMMLNRFISVHALGFVLYNLVHMTNWVINGIPEKFPGLKSIWIESGLAWIPFLMQRLDNEYMMRMSEAPSLKRLPSEYMQEMFYTSQPMEKPKDLSYLENTFRMIKAETQVLWSSDYPHWDFDLPSTIYDLPFLSEQAKRNILGGNALRLFNMELPAYAQTPVAAQ